MKEYIFNNGEVLLYEGNVTLNEKKLKLLLTNQKIILQKRVGLIKKKYKIVKEISLNEIVVYKNKVQIKQKDKLLIIKTLNKRIRLYCESSLEAKRISREINKVKVGNIITNPDKFESIIKATNNAKKILKVVLSIAIAMKAYHEQNK